MKKLTISTLASKSILAGGIATICFPILAGLILSDLKNGWHFTYSGYLTTIVTFAALYIAWPVSRRVSKQHWSLRRKLVYVLLLILMVVMASNAFSGDALVNSFTLVGLFNCLFVLDTATEYLTRKQS